MTKIRLGALAWQFATIPIHFAKHQWMHEFVCASQKHRFGPHPRQYLMFWKPPAGIPLRDSVVVFYHGGGWRLGWPDQFPTVAEWFLREGYPVVLPAYRLLPRYAFPAMREDLNLAIQKTIEVLAVNGLDRHKMLLGGMSAGATLAAHLAFNRQALAQVGISQDQFSGFLSCGGPLDLTELPDVQPLRGFAGKQRDNIAFQNANPINLLTPNETLPILLIHGTNDAIVPFSSSEHFFKRYSGPKVLYPIAGGSHLDSLNFALNEVQTSSKLRNWLAYLEDMYKKQHQK